MKPKPWSKRWERPQHKIQGIRFELYLTDRHIEKARKLAKPWEEFDMLKEYDTTKIESKIWEEVNQKLNQPKAN